MTAAEAAATCTPLAPPEDEGALRKLIGKRVRAERVWRDLSQSDLAAKTGVTRNFVSAIERGAQGLDGYRLARIAEALGLTMTDLFDNTGREQRHYEEETARASR